MKTYGQSLVNDVRDLLGPKVANHKELFISCVNKIFNRWIRGVYKNETQVIDAIQSTFYKNLSFEEGYTVFISSPIGESIHTEYTQQYAPRIAEKLGKQTFAERIGANAEYEHYTQELVPYLEELKKAQAKKEVSDWKRVEKEAGVSSKVPADIKEHEVIMNYLLKKGQITKRQAEGLREWQQVDNHVGARRRKFLEPYTLEGSLSEKIQKVKYFLNRLGSARIEARTLARETQ